MDFVFNHFNFNVTNLQTSLDFYEKALGFHEVGRIEAEDGAYVIVYLGDGKSDFRLELTWLKDHPQKYDLGECEFHLALTTDDYQKSFDFHQQNGWVCFVNDAMGIYFIEDPDGYWIEILPPQK